MDEALTAALREYFAKNRGGSLDIAASRPADDPQVVHLRATFRNGNRYCCAEPGCHVGPNWRRLRAIAAEYGILLPEPITLHFQGVVEAGAYLEHCGGSSAAYEYATVFHEADKDNEH